MTTEHRRSEIVRARRSQRLGSSKRKKSRKNASQRRMPPMVSRRGMVVPREMASRRKGKKKVNRRRYDVALGTTGAEIRLPAVAVPKVGWRVVSFLLLAVLGFAFYWLWTSPQFTVTEDRVTVDGLLRVERSSLLQKSGFLNQPVFTLDPEALEENLPESIPALESIKVSVSLSGAVAMEVSERVPVLTWDQQNIDQISWVDQEGKLYPAIGSSEGLIYVQANAAPPIPVEVKVQETLAKEAATQAAIEESAGEPMDQKTDDMLLTPDLIDGILALSKYLPAGTTLFYDGDHGFGWQDPETEGMVYFGKQLDQVALRYSIYQEIANMFENKDRKPVLVSVEYLHAPFYRLEP